MGPSRLRTPGFRSYLGTLFLGAFNDNAFRLVISFLALGVLAEGRESGYIALAGFLFMLPYVLFSAYAGYLADRFSKSRVMVWAKVAEIVIMGLGGWALWCQSLGGLLLVLFLMAAQSTF
ncbi:MAG: MFS transporter, partial [Lentisphaeria bacterium]|nr:MFS transporter [Lentisphaeria bacterium]